MTDDDRDRYTNRPDPRADHDAAVARLQAVQAAAGVRLFDAVNSAGWAGSAVAEVAAVRRALAAYRAEVGPAADAEAAAAERAGL